MQYLGAGQQQLQQLVRLEQYNFSLSCVLYPCKCCPVRLAEKVAVKILDKTRLDLKTQRMLAREISNMDKLVHPHVVRLFQVVETLTRIHLVMEYAGGGELYTHITTKGKLPEDEAKTVFSQLVSAVSYMVSFLNIVMKNVLTVES